MHVHLVDGTFELFRCFFGAPPRQRADGLEVGATRGLVSTLLSLVKQPECTHVGIAFDTVIESFRNDLFAGYKTGAGIDPNLHAQFPLVEQAARALGFITWSMIDFECDDALATMAARAVNDDRVERVHLCSPDKDLCQMVQAERVVLVDRIRKKTIDEAGVVEKFGVPPRLIPDLLALVGDDADGVPGLAGFGMKGAAAVLNHFGSVEGIPNAPWPTTFKVRGAEALAATFTAHRDDALLYKRLTTLRTDVPLAESVDDLRWRGPNAALLTQLATDLDDAALVERVEKAWSEHRARVSAG